MGLRKKDGTVPPFIFVCFVVIHRIGYGLKPKPYDRPQNILFLHQFQILHFASDASYFYDVLARAKGGKVELHRGGLEKYAACEVDDGGTDEAISENCNHIGGGIRVERHCRGCRLGDAVADMRGYADGLGCGTLATGDGERDALRTGIIELKHFGATSTACAP